jgi:hypothetical protein
MGISTIATCRNQAQPMVAETAGIFLANGYRVPIDPAFE